MVRMVTLCWLWIAALLVLQFLTPSPWSSAAVVLIFPPLLSIPWLNRQLARARAKDESLR